MMLLPCLAVFLEAFLDCCCLFLLQSVEVEVAFDSGVEVQISS